MRNAEEEGRVRGREDEGEAPSTRNPAVSHTPPPFPLPLFPSLDECRECEWATLNVGQQGQGRIPVSWMAIACATGGTPISYLMVVRNKGGRKRGSREGGRGKGLKRMMAVSIMSLRASVIG